MVDIYEKITDVFVNALKGGIIPWNKTWISYKPKNLYSKNEYRGINQLLLSTVGEQWYVTYRQAQMLGGTINKGAKGIPVVYWNFLESKTQTDINGKAKRIPFLKYSTVFPLSMTSGLESKVPVTIVNESNPIECAEQVIARNTHNKAIGNPSYSPSRDTVNMPEFKSFVNAESYYTVYFHELTHWTGHNSRLDRSEGMKNLFGDHLYSQEELVAELGANFLASECGMGIEKTLDNSIAYIQSWIRVLENDPKFIVEASTKARKACELLIGKQNEVAIEEVA